MRKIIILVFVVLFAGCTSQKTNPDLSDCKTETIYEYEQYMGLIIGGRDRTPYSEKLELEEGMDPNMVGVWESTPDTEGRFQILVIYEDGYATIILIDYTGLLQIYEESFLGYGTIEISGEIEILKIRGGEFTRVK